MVWHDRFAQYIYGIYLGLNGLSPAFCLILVIFYCSVVNELTYCVTTALPFLIRTELLLAPLLPLLVGYIVSLLGFNVGRRVLSAYLDL